VCTLLGHELAEILADKKAGARNWEEHHYKIANPVEDAIVKDYFNEDRTRGKDCRVRHGNHDDIVLEYTTGLSRMHLAPDRVEFHLDYPLGHIAAGRLGYITYEPGAKFPGFSKDGNA